MSSDHPDVRVHGKNSIHLHMMTCVTSRVSEPRGGKTGKQQQEELTINTATPES